MDKKRLGSFLAALALILPAAAHGEIMGDYMGATACIECHGDIAKGWKATPHAHAFASLKTQGEEKQSIPGCFRCHVVGFEQDGGYVDMSLTPELVNVQCENCHGPARQHVQSGGDPELITQQPDEASCRVCHTEGQDKNFDYATKKQWVHAPEGHEKKSTLADAGPVLQFSETRVSFGDKMIEGDVAQKKVTLTNTGKEVITITNVTTS
jgi:hypothetical protein